MPRILPDGNPHDWPLDYTPSAVARRGQMVLPFDGQTVTHSLRTGDWAPGVAFDRFGLVTTWIDGNAQTICFDDLSWTDSQDVGGGIDRADEPRR